MTEFYVFMNNHKKNSDNDDDFYKKVILCFLTQHCDKYILSTKVDKARFYGIDVNVKCAGSRTVKYTDKLTELNEPLKIEAWLYGATTWSDCVLQQHNLTANSDPKLF